MLEQSWDESEVDFMRSQLHHENWFDHRLLPAGWKVRAQEDKANSKDFLSKEVTVFKSYRKALEYISTYMGEGELVNFQLYSAEESKVSRTTNYQWEHHPSLPHGWKMRTSDAKKFYLAPTNEQFPVKRLALKFMVERGDPEEEVEVMRRGLEDEGWRADPLLPQGWRFRTQDKKQANSNHFLTRDGTFFKSFKTAAGHVRASSSYSEGEEARLQQFAVEGSRRNRAAVYR